mmetsp:Transcript_2476/g.3801  ORF Transcript_2476/g.3801 Transcript_2476/m.3801 type:complete len:501 (+) Transcript_2476:81-1583(+)
MSTTIMTQSQAAHKSAYFMRQRTEQQRHHFTKSDDADVAAGVLPSSRIPTSTSEIEPLIQNTHSQTPAINEEHDETIYATISNSAKTFDDPQLNKKVLVFGCDISHLSRKYQFITCASGVVSFSLLYGFLQELISVTLCSRQLGLFLAMVQFMGYTLWSRFFNYYVQKRHGHSLKRSREKHGHAGGVVPIKYYIVLSILRAIDASMTNMAMAYVNYPAKTLMKSSRVVFTMLFGTIVSRKRYKLMDYLVVLLMVSGLAIFMHADSQSSAVFQPLGIIMLTISLCCDAVINNMSERIMNLYHVGQDEFIYKLYSIALLGIVGAAAIRGDLVDGTKYILTPGTYQEILDGEEATWSVRSKILAFVLFSSTGFLGSSCSALITKEFGALTMSITSTARKATTLFLSFALFKENVCTLEHVGGISLFVTALIGKSIRASRKGHGDSNDDVHHKKKAGGKNGSPNQPGDYMEMEKPLSPGGSYYNNTDRIKRRGPSQRQKKMDMV